MKYKRLSHQELTSLQEDFIKYLASNTITADDWTSIKNTEPSHAEEIINHFSDLVTEQSLEQTEYLELITTHQVQVIFCGKTEMNLLGLYALGQGQIDFTAFSSVKELLENAVSNPGIKMISGTKKYQAERNPEIYAEINKGFKIVKKSLLYDGLLVFTKK